jgi:hypothetical protein
MSLLEGQIAAVFSQAFSGIYLDGLLYRPDPFADDGAGGGANGGFGTPQPVKYQPEETSQDMRSTEGYVDTDQRFFLLAHGISEPNTDCELAAGGKRWSIYACQRDPGSTYYDLFTHFLRDA